MDEMRTHPARENAAPAERTTLWERFGGFAMAHICYSLVGMVIYPILFGMLISSSADLVVKGALIVLFGSLSMAVYFLMGMLTAKWRDWSVPTAKEKVWAVVQPCFISVSWAIFILALVYVLDGVDTTLAVVVGLISWVMASPSSWFYICCGFVCGSITLSALWAAVLPPLLFGLGSFWQSKRQERKRQAAITNEAGE